MLLLTQNIGESIYVFDKDDNEILKITYLDKTGSQIRMGFFADKEITILREKVLERRQLKGNVINPDKPIFFMEEDMEDLL